MDTTKTVLQAILDGVCDHDLDLVIETIKQRRNTIANQRLVTLSIGDKVTLVNVSPKYLDGLTAVITGRSGNKFLIKLEQPELAGRFADLGEMRCPPSILEPVTS